MGDSGLSALFPDDSCPLWPVVSRVTETAECRRRRIIAWCHGLPRRNEL